MPRRRNGPQNSLERSATLNCVATVLVASDLASLRHELRTMLEGPDLFIEEAASGREVTRPRQRGRHRPGRARPADRLHGRMAICMELRHEESYGAADPVSVLMLLDRRPDVFLARRSGCRGLRRQAARPATRAQRRARAAARRELRGRIAAPRHRPRRQRRRLMSDSKPPPSGLARFRARLSGRVKKPAQHPRGRGHPRPRRSTEQARTARRHDASRGRRLPHDPGDAPKRSPKPCATPATRAFRS